ncbi:MAG: GGDEF and EAL domain-containing protein [Lachnospiraceae bacterium]|nr:GGDEF and EAL domain-containing protein [Lachnospiraceae bacterium]
MEKNKEKVLACQIMDMSEQAMVVFAPDDFSIIYANTKARNIWGDNLTGLTCYQGFDTRTRPCMDCPFMNLKIGEEYITGRYYESFDLKVRVKGSSFVWEDGRRVILCAIQDSESLVLAKKEKETLSEQQYKEKLRLSGELYQTVVSQLKTIVFEYNYEEKTSYVSTLFKDRFGVENISDVDFLEGEDTKKLIYEEDLSVYELLFKGRADDFREITCRLCEKNGRVAWYRICIQFMRDEQHNVIRAIGTLKDVDELMKSHEAIRYRSEYDMLTGLYNATRFYIDAGNAVLDESSKHAVISFDIDRFKMINDLFGMKAGDDVLCHVADVLKSRLPEGSICCRVHSDVFFVCIAYTKKGDIIKLIEKIRKAIYKNEFAFDINTSFGVYLVQDRAVPINLMCDRATLAGRTVKTSAMKFCAFYDEQYRVEMLKTTEIERDMNAALASKQFVMYLQPKYNLASGNICGAEVLSRWKHPLKGLIQPNDFIPLFERNGFILRLDEYMWEEACKALAMWRNEGKEPVPLSVNISRYHIHNNDLVSVWRKLLRKYDIKASDLTLEITETFFYDSDDLYDVLKELQDMGFMLEVDDFGAGYSSLNMIRQIPVNTIKIDKDFLDKKLSTEKGKIVISHTIAMAKDLKLSVVAEGVETKEHVDFLKSSACDIAQGYYFAKPMPLEEFSKLCYGDK